MSKTYTTCKAITIPPLSNEYFHLNTVVQKNWLGLNSFDCTYVWSDGIEIYYSDNDEQYVLNGDTWEEKIWDGEVSFAGSQVWTDGKNIYVNSFSGLSYMLNGNTWEAYVPLSTTPISGTGTFNGGAIWTDGIDIYLYINPDPRIGTYIFNKETSTWETKTWNGFADTSASTKAIWIDGVNIYYSHNEYQYILNKETDTWEPKTWNGVVPSHGNQIWSDGINIYYSDGDKHYILNGDIWEIATFGGVSFSGEDVWTDGTNIYFSNDNKQYALLPTTAKFYSKINGSWMQLGYVSPASLDNYVEKEVVDQMLSDIDDLIGEGV